jgi:hypothetical protein
LPELQASKVIRYRLGGAYFIVRILPFCIKTVVESLVAKYPKAHSRRRRWLASAF